MNSALPLRRSSAECVVAAAGQRLAPAAIRLPSSPVRGARVPSRLTVHRLLLRLPTAHEEPSPAVVRDIGLTWRRSGSRMVTVARAALASTRHHLAHSAGRVAVHARAGIHAGLDPGYVPDRACAGPTPSTVEVSKLWVSYGRRVALADVTQALRRAHLTAVVGPNGAGKSSFLKSVAGLRPPVRGEVRRIAAVGQPRLAYLPQSVELDRNFPMTVRELVALGCWRGAGGFREFSHQLLMEVDAALGATGLQRTADRFIAELSVGELQRALFARVLLQDASIILLDEPFIAVDQRTTDELLALVGRWHAEGRTVIAVLHDFQQVRLHFPTALLLARTVIAHGDTTTVLSEENVDRARAALDSLPGPVVFND